MTAAARRQAHLEVVAQLDDFGDDYADLWELTDDYCDDWFGCDCQACLDSFEVGAPHLDKMPLTQRLPLAA